MLSHLTSPRFLSRVMWIDAATCAATGVLQLGLTERLASATGLPAGLLLATGWFLVVYALAAAAMAAQATPPRRLIGLVAIGNLGWAVACLVVLASGWFTPTGIGWAWVLVQAVTVVLLAELQWMGLRATRPHPLAPAL